ncbi:MAG: heavy metal translocating P-type ATPase [Actinomycetota bacterium]|nr:heavy metal translocating P-type ATPase [Actinomycetota bacterium]
MDEIGRSDHGTRGGHRAPTESGDHAGHDEHAGHEEHAGHDEHAGHEGRAAHGDHRGHAGHAARFRDRFWISLALSVPVLVFSEMIQGWLGFRLPDLPGQDLVAPILGTAVFVYGGQPFLAGAVEEVRARRPGMMLLIALALTVAFGASLASVIGWLDLEFWWELTLLVDVMLLGHWMEMRALGQASGALEALASLLPETAERVTDGGTDLVPLDALHPDDVVLVRPGGRVPADGAILEGEAAFDESMITGESRPVTRQLGEGVVGGTVAVDSSVRVRITAIGEETTLAGIRRLVEDAQASRSRAQALADRAAALLFYVALGSGAITLLTWLAMGEPDQAMERTITVLVIACPHALGLAIPLVIAISTAVSAKEGILVKDRLALERMRTVDTVLLDKTGTLTTGRPEVRDVIVDEGDQGAVLSLAAAAEADSEHPLARAIVEEARRRGLVIPGASGFRSMSGRGVRAVVDGSQVAVGGPALLRELSLAVPSGLEEPVAAWRRRGATVLSVVRDGKSAGVIILEDAVRPESRQTVHDLRAEGLRVLMITGDAREVAEAVGKDLGIDEVRAEVLPEHKEAVVVGLQEEGRRVAMVGDGVNDAPALARSDVGIAIGAGTDVAIESAGVVLASDDPRGVVSVLRLSRSSYSKMVQNLAWATGYNVLAIPLAAGVLAPWGFVFPPAVGALAMSLSTIVVACNALLLKRLDLRSTEGSAELAPA